LNFTLDQTASAVDANWKLIQSYMAAGEADAAARKKRIEELQAGIQALVSETPPSWGLPALTPEQKSVLDLLPGLLNDIAYAKINLNDAIRASLPEEAGGVIPEISPEKQKAITDAKEALDGLLSTLGGLNREFQEGALDEIMPTFTLEQRQSILDLQNMRKELEALTGVGVGEAPDPAAAFGTTLEQLAIKAGNFDTAMTLATDNARRNFGTLATDISALFWGQSVFPEFNTQIDAWGQEWKDTIDDTIIPAIYRVIAALALIPTSIVTKITITDPPAPNGPFIEPEVRIAEIIATLGEIPNQIPVDVAVTTGKMPNALPAQALPAQVQAGAMAMPYIGSAAAGVYIGGDSYDVSVTDTLSLALFQAMMKGRRRERRSAFMGV
jgi:hypothetical protein